MMRREKKVARERSKANGSLRLHFLSSSPIKFINMCKIAPYMVLSEAFYICLLLLAPSCFLSLL